MNKRARGLWGEQKAVEFLVKKGYTVIARNFRSRRGEIDIIAQDGEQLVFVEVKVIGAYGKGELERMIGKGKQSRIRECARVFLLMHNEQRERRLRFDVIAVIPGEGEPYHIENAF